MPVFIGENRISPADYVSVDSANARIFVDRARVVVLFCTTSRRRSERPAQSRRRRRCAAHVVGTDASRSSCTWWNRFGASLMRRLRAAIACAPRHAAVLRSWRFLGGLRIIAWRWDRVVHRKAAIEMDRCKCRVLSHLFSPSGKGFKNEFTARAHGSGPAPASRIIPATSIGLFPPPFRRLARFKACCVVVA